MTAATSTDIHVQLYGHQHDFVFTPVKNAALFGGVGSGKSHAGAVRAVMAALGSIGGQDVPVPNLGQVTAPTYRMLKDATLRSFLDVAGDAVETVNKSDFTAVMRNGSEVLFRSTDNPDTLRGPNLLWWHGDEAALYTPDVWRIMIGRLRQHGMRGWDWLTTTPKGRNWVWQEFVRDQRDDYVAWRLPTAQNPFIDAEFVESLRRAYTGDFAAQELEGEFVAFEGLIYADFRHDVHVQRTRPERFVYTIAGVDWGFANPGVIGVLGIDTDGRAWAVAEYYQRRVRVEEWATLATQVQREHNVQTFFCDPSEPEYIDAFIREGVNAQAADNRVLPGIQTVKNYLAIQSDGRPRFFVSPDCVHTLSEFDSYQWATNKYGIRDQPVKANDHTMDTWRYALMGAHVPELDDGGFNYVTPYRISGSDY